MDRQYLEGQASTMFAIEEYLVVGSSEQPRCKATGQDSSLPQMERIVCALTEQSEFLVTITTKLEVIALASKGAPLIPRYSELSQPAHCQER